MRISNMSPYRHAIPALAASLLLAVSPPGQSGDTAAVTLTLMHTNDTHSHIETFTDGIAQGGVARRKALVDRVRAELGPDTASHTTLLVDAGDFSQGTVFFNTWEGSESIMAMNAMGYDVATLGNHEFDLPPDRLARLLSGSAISIAGSSYATEKPNFPLISSNLDFSSEPALRGQLQPLTVIDKGGQKYGVIGITTTTLPRIANIGPHIRVRDYVPSVNSASALLAALGVNKIILLSHSGHEEDLAQAPGLAGVDIIVSAHDHALLGDPAAIDAASAGTQGRYVVGPYPMETRDRDGNKLLLVSAYEWGRWLGRLEVDFDAAGHVLAARNKSMFVDAATVPEDPALAAKVAAYKAPMQAFAGVKVGTSAIPFPAPRGNTGPNFAPGLRTGETLLGNLVADVMQEAAAASDQAVAAITNGGGLRADLPAGDITYGQALSVLPFGNGMAVLDVTGKELLETLELSIGEKMGGGGFLQLSRNLRVDYCASAPCPHALKAGGRLTSVQIAGQPLEASRTYRVVTNDFLSRGSEGYTVLGAACKRPGNYCRDTGMVILDLLVARLKTGVPLTASIDGRINRH